MYADLQSGQKKINCAFEVGMQFVSLDTSLTATVRAEVQDLREIKRR